jgi:recombination protein RecA
MALRFYASVRLDVRRIESIKQADQVIGNRTRVTVKKNKVAPPFKTAEFDIMYNEGISSVGDILDLGVEYDILSKRGAFFRFQEEMIGQGREAAKEYLRTHPQVAQQIDSLIRAKAGLTGEGERSRNGAATDVETVALSA